MSSPPRLASRSILPQRPLYMRDSAKLSTEGTATPSSGFLPRTSNQLYCHVGKLIEIWQTASRAVSNKGEGANREGGASSRREWAGTTATGGFPTGFALGGRHFFSAGLSQQVSLSLSHFGLFLVRGQFRIGLCNRFIMCLANTKLLLLLIFCP